MSDQLKDHVSKMLERDLIKVQEDCSVYLPWLVTIEQTSQYLKVGNVKVLKLVHDGKLEMVHIGRMSRIVGRSIQKYIEELPRGIRTEDRQRMSAVARGIPVAER